MEKSLDLSRRSFLKSVGIAVPTLRQVAAQAPVPAALERPVANKFSPVPLDAFFTASGADLGPREQMRRGGAAANGLIRTPGGSQAFRGIPFELGPEDTDRKSWAVLTTKPATWGSRRLEVPASGAASFVCVAAFCDWDPDETPAPTAEVTERVGQRLADVVFLYDDGTEARAPIRRRFEVNALTIPWGHLPFAAVAHRSDRPTTLNSPLGDATQWGSLQLGVWEGSYPNGPQQGPPVTVWICALPNPAPDRRLRAIAFEAAAEDLLAICGITLFRGRENPLRYDRLTLYRVTLPGPASDGDGRWKATIDLGVIARTYLLHDFDAAQWLASSGPPSGLRAGPVRDSRHLYLEVSASPEATLTISDTKAGVRFDFALGQVRGEGELAATVQGARVEVLDRQKTWLHGRVVDAGTGRPTPARLAFRSARGRYIPPYGHRSEINRGWFQDYGADVLIGDDAFAYVDGTFQVELPAGEVFVEVSKGFEYEQVRRKLDIRPGQRDLDVTIGRIADLRPRGWVSADTHVHFLSPSTAILEGQAEGLNLINLLAAQWGDLFTNVGDLPHGTLVSRDGRTLVKVGTENRQHLLGHIALINRDSDPVYPMSAAGQNESYIGDPVWTSLAEWADACRARDGLVVGMHFPYPTGELAADIVLGKIDAVELEPKIRPDPFGSLVFRDWYRYLDCGYRLAAAAGTDKMSAGIAVGANRMYAFLGSEELTFDRWAAAVKQGNTFVTSGPLLFFEADGRRPGAEIVLGAGGGTVGISAEATSAVPLNRLEVLFNGRIVSSHEERAGARVLKLADTVRLDGPGWLAARTVSSRIQASFSHAAHTSPVYVRVPGREAFSPAAASYFLTLIDGVETWTKQLATRPDPDRLARLIKVFTDAREHLHRRLHQQGVPH